MVKKDKRMSTNKPIQQKPNTIVQPKAVPSPATPPQVKAKPSTPCQPTKA